LLQRGTGADAAGEKLCLTLGDRALDGRWRFNGAALEIITDQLRGIEVRAQHYGIGQHMGQRPMGIKWGAKAGRAGVVSCLAFCRVGLALGSSRGFCGEEQAPLPQGCSAPDVGRVS
jgi:hypothetical protein